MFFRNKVSILSLIITFFICTPANAVELQVANAHGFVFEPWEGNGLSDSDLKARFKSLAETGARHLTFLIFICQKDKYSNIPGECGSFKANLESRIHWARLAKEMDFEVDLTLFPRTEKWDIWRGLFEPTNVDLWFQNYEKALVEVATASKKLHAGHLNLATEMQSMYKHGKKWQKLASRIRTIYPGPISINTSWTSMFHDFWHSVDYISISAYFALTLRKHPTLWELRAAWKPYKAVLKRISKTYNKPIIFAEIGYMSKVGAARIPSDFSPGKQDLAIQKKAFQAFYEEWKDESILKKTVIWSTTGKLSRGSEDYEYNPLGKPAMDILKLYFQNQ